MKKTLTVVRYALVSLFSFVFIGSAMAEKMYNNPLDGKANVPAGTYGDITVSGNGYMATTFASNTDFTDAAVAGTWKDNLKINTHTWSAWYKIDALPASGWKAIYADRTATDGDYGGYALSVGSDGKLKVGRCKGSLQYNDGVEFSAGIAANTWYYITVVMSENSSTLTPSVYVNGVAVSASSGTTFASGMNGSRYSKFTLGAGVSAAGLYIDTTALSDVTTIKSLATDANYVVPYVPAVEATITAEAVKVSDINNAPEFVSCGTTDKVVVKLTAAKTLEFDTTLKFAGVDIVYDGALKLLANAVPADFAKFNFAGVTSIDYGWIVVGSGMAINFRHNNGEGLGDDEDAGISGLTIYGKCWNNGGASGNVEAKMFAPGGDSVIADTMSVTWNSGNTWYNNAATSPLLKGYLDDSNITFSTTVPFGYYDVYIICTTDNGSSFLYKTVNGTAYIAGANGVAVEKTTMDTWGNPSEKIPVLGSNVMKLSGLTSKNLTITSPNAAKPKRGCIAAIVIVKAEPPAETVKATIAENTTWSALWAGGTALTANTPVELTFTGSATLTIDTEVVAKDIKIFGNATSAQTITLAGDQADAFLGKVISIDDSASTASTTFDFNVGAMPVKAGANTIVKGVNNGNLTIDSGKKLTVKSGALTASTITNNGTLNFEGGSEDAPIAIRGDADFGTVTLAANTYVKNTENNSNHKHVVTGQGASSYYFMMRDNGGSPGMAANTTFSNLTLVSACYGNNNKVWVENTTFTDGTVGLRMDGPMILNNSTESVVRSLTGNSDLTRYHNNETVTIRAKEDAEFAGACNFPITVDESNYTQTFSGNFTGALTVNAGGKVKLSGSANPSSITANGEVTIDVASGATMTIFGAITGSGDIIKTGAGKLVVKGSLAGYTGTITIAEGAYDIGGVRDFSAIGNIVTSGTGVISATAIVADDGEVKITNVPAGTELVVYDIDGVTPLATTVSGTTVTAAFTIKTDGEACLYDWTFKADSLTSVGQIKSTLTWDTGWRDGDPAAVNRILESEDFVYGKALNTKATPYSDFTINYPTEWTCVVAGIVPNNENAALIAFGTRGGGSIAILKGATDTEVKIVRTIGNSAYVPLATMQVANALTTSHTYAFVKTANAITVYLDGNLWNTTPVSNVSFGDRIQVGSIHGGKGSTNIESSKDATNATAIQAVRIFEGALGPNALKQLADEFPYNSPNGTFAREFAAGEGTWTLTDSWTDTKTQETAELPTEGSTLNISAAGAAEITVDLTAETEYEAMTFSGAAMTFKAGDASAVNIGLTTVAAPIEIEYGSISIANGPFVVSGNGSVAFDYSAAPIDNFKGFGFVALTGTTGELADGKVTCTLPDKTLPGRVVTFGYSTEHKAYGVTTAADRSATTLYLTADTTLGDDTLFALTDGGDAVTPRMFAEDVIVVPSGKTLTLPTTALAIPLGEIDGAGKVVLGAQSAITLADTWTGTVKFLDCAINNDPTLDTFGNENSKIEIENCTGYQATRTLPCVILTGEGFAANNGHSGDTVTFTKLEGSGKLTVTSGQTETWKLVDIADYDGVITVGGGMSVSIGEATRSAGGAIDFADGVTVKAGLGWTATSATFGDTLTVKGALGDTLVSGLAVAPASVPAVMLVGEEGDYTLAYADGKLTIVNASVAVAIPTIADTTVVVYAGEDELTPDQDGNVAVPYGANIFVTYIVEDGKVFKDGSYMVELEYENVTTENIPNVQADIDDLETIDDVVPEASAEKLDPIPEGMATAATFAVTEAGSENYADFTATFTITANKDVAQDAIVLAGQFNATDLEDPEGVNNNYDGEWIDMPLTSGLTANEPYTVVSQPWKFVTEFVKTFNCGLKDVALAEDTSFTVTLTVYKEEFAVLEKEITLDVVAKKLPTAMQDTATIEGCDVAVKYTLGTAAVGYDDWNVDFEVSSDVALDGDEFTLKGSNPLDGETMVDFPSFALEANTPVKLLATFAPQFKVTYAQLIEATTTYTCGVVNNVKQDANVTVKIVLSKEGEEDIVVEGSTFNATLKAKAIEPVVPGKDIDIPADKNPEEYAGEVEAQKATLLKAPVELTGEALATYQGYFTAQVVGDKVAFVLNTDGEAVVEEAVKTVETDVLSVALSDDAELTIAKPLKGFYYSLKQGGELTNLGFNDAGDKNKLGGKDEIKFTLTKPEGKGFYQTIVTPVEYK